MEEVRRTAGAGRSWWLALAALALLTPWAGWQPPAWAGVGIAALLLVVSRPRGTGWLPWLAVGIGLVGILAGAGRPPSPERLSLQLDDHVKGLLHSAERAAADPELLRLFAGSGEALDPLRPFAILDREVGSRLGRTAYLADDRGRLVAWGGEERSYPYGVRPLGERRPGVVWSARGAVLYVREPVLVEGRLVGAITVADWTPLEGSTAWGLRAPLGRTLVLGQNAPERQLLTAASASGVEVPVGLGTTNRRQEVPRAAAWLALVIVVIGWRPRMAWLVVVVAVVACLGGAGAEADVGLAVVLLLAGIAVHRSARALPAVWARLLVAGFVAALLACVVGAGAMSMSPLPSHLLRAGLGGAWMLAMALAVSGWPRLAVRDPLTLELRLAVAGGIALVGLVLEVARVPLELSRAVRDGESVVLPRDDVALGEVLPAPTGACRLDDAAPALAERWGLARWQTPSELRLLDASSLELSVWGDLAPAGDSVRRIRQWQLQDPPGSRLELWVATEPWAVLDDWNSGQPLGAARRQPVWFAALTRSGTVAATLHPEIADLDAATAGGLYHAGGGWAWIRVGGERTLSRLQRRGEWLVAAIGRYPAPVVWVLRTAIAGLWALAGLLIALPPTLRREQLSTFGGRLRLLVAGGVVMPLAVLTVFLQLRLTGEAERFDQLVGLDALGAARYTANQLSGGFAVDDEIARWVSGGWAGEVLLFDEAEVVAVSRPDLLATGALPQLPPADALRSYLIGRNDAVVVRSGDTLVAVGPVELEGRRLLLELVRLDPRLEDSALAAVDWLLTGALLAAVLALALSSRIERRLSVSLRDLVLLSRRLLHGEPLPEVRRPVETDLAEVLDAVRSMNAEVQRRESSLRSQEELLRITLSTLVPAVMVLEAGGELRFANPSAEALRAEHGKRLLEVVHAVAARGVPDGSPLAETLQPVPGQETTWRVGVVGVPLPDGSRGLVAVVDDVTDVVRMDRLRQLNQLARIVAHEVKNPLTPIRLWVQELEAARRAGHPKFEELAGDACREIALQVDRLQDTANSFSNLVALERWQSEVFDLGELVTDTLGGLTIYQRRGIELVADLPGDGGCKVRGDRQWLQRALGNLVKNSVDAIGDGGGEVRVGVRRAGELVTLEVDDTAGGLPDHQLQDLFSPHFSTTTSGSGLGLALVQQVVTRCHGRVTAANGERGLAVRIELPAADPGL
jgi:nitrogen-specific signal transduction histidine kinase